MSVLVSAETVFYLADLTVVPLTLTLSQGENNLSIQQKPMEVLCYLARQYPALVTREQLIDVVWDGNVYVGEKALTNTIWQLRQALTQLGQAELIATVRKKGYRLQLAPQWAPSRSAFPATSANVTDLPTAALLEPAINQPTLTVKGASKWQQSAGWACSFVLLSLLLALQFWPRKDSGFTQISQQQGWSMYPTVSVDGRLLVYSWQLFGQPADLFVQDLTQPAQPPRQLTFTAEDESQSVLSPDGKTLFYSVKSTDGRSCEIRQMSLQTLQEQVLKDCKGQGDVYLDLSYDNRFLYFNGRKDEQGSSLYQLDLQQQPFQITAVPCSAHCAQRVRDIAVDPQGRYIALTRRANRLSEEIFLYDQQNNEETQLTFGHSDIRGLAWTPDGEKLIFSSESHGRSQGYVYDVKNQLQSPIPLDDVSFVSRATQQNAVFFHRDSSVPQLGYVQLNQATAVFPLTAGDLSYQSPDFHQTRAELVYISSESGATELWVADRDLRQKRQLTRLGGMIKYPRWSHSGDKILFVSRDAGSTDDRLTILDVATGKLEFPVTGIRVHGRPTWTADDSAVLLAGNDHLMKFDLSTKTSKDWHKLGVSYIQMLNDQGFFFSKGRGQGIWWQALKEGEPDGKPEQLISGELFIDSYNWVATQDAIIYQQTAPDGVAIRQMQLADRHHQTLVVLPVGQIDSSVNITFDAKEQRLIMQYSPVPRIDIWRWQLP